MRRGAVGCHDVRDAELCVRRGDEAPGLALLAVADHGGDLGHRRKALGLDLRRAAGDENARVGAAAGGTADFLPGLLHRLGRHRAAVDDDEIVLIAGECAHRLALRRVEAAAQRDDFGPAHAPNPSPNASPNASRSSSPVKTWVAGPVIRMVLPGCQSMMRSPPGRDTVTPLFARPDWIAATAVAQAPVPQASVRPAPRSQTRRRMRSGLSTVATLTLTRSGKTGSCSMTGPIAARSSAWVSGTKNMMCGLPTLSAIGAASGSSPSQPSGSAAVSIAKASGTASHSKRGAPMSMLAPPVVRLLDRMPPSVSIEGSPPSSVATQRVALPQASTSPPSALKIRIFAVATSEGSIRISWSQPMPVWRSAMARARAADIATARSRASNTTKSLPSPCIL